MKWDSLSHKLIQWDGRLAKQNFFKQSSHLESVQRHNLSKWLSHFSPQHANLRYEEVIHQFEPLDISNPPKLWEKWKNENLVKNWVPTSGSTSKRKWIPYTPQFKSELGLASRAWLGDLYEKYPAISKGQHYWSLSWIPTDIRNESHNDDIDSLPWWQKILVSQIMSVPSQIQWHKTAELSWWALLIHLSSCRNLSLISVWSPTILLEIVSSLEKNWDEIFWSLKNQKWSRHQEDFSQFSFPKTHSSVDRMSAFNLKSLWPQLGLISCWDSSTSTSWSEQVKKIFTDIPLQGKGLWSTEGVVSIPMEDRKLLSFQSHFYEFRDLSSQKILPAWKLEPGMEVQPIIWAGNGLARGFLMDRVRVREIYKGLPDLEFISRLHGVDLVGEKIDTELAQSILTRLEQSTKNKWISLLAIKNDRQYCGLYLCNEDDPTDQASHLLEEQLVKLHHYRLARELHQLKPSKAVAVRSLHHAHQLMGKSLQSGSTKIENLILKESWG